MELEFSGHHALILGGTCELGLGLTKALIRAGLYVVLTSRREKSTQEIGTQLQPFSGKYEVQHLEMSDPGTADTLFERINTPPDYLIDFVQSDFERLIASADSETVSQYFEHNLSFRTRILKNAARAMMKKRAGRLVFISSTAAGMPNPGQGFYSAAKQASEALYRNLGIELGEKGITTVSLRPGYVASGRGKKYLQVNDTAAIEKIPIKRALTEKEVVETIMFFLSDSARGFNATEIKMDGGLTACK